MPVFLLNDDPEDFPPVDATDPSGLLAVGGDLSPRRLLAAYSHGIFPWYSEGQPILWHSPNPRMVLEPSRLHVPKSLRKNIHRGLYEVRFDSNFSEVIEQCSNAARPGQDGTWITDDMKEAYVELHRLGFAHSIESWSNGELQGGLYGISLGAVFFGESMFARAPDASKVAFVSLVEQLTQWGFTLVDCQQQTEHLARFGAEPWPRKRFLTELAKGLQVDTRRGKWP